MSKTSKELMAEADALRAQAHEVERVEKVAELRARFSRLADRASLLDRNSFSSLDARLEDLERWFDKRAGVGVDMIAAVRAGNGVWDGGQ